MVRKEECQQLLKAVSKRSAHRSLMVVVSPIEPHSDRTTSSITPRCASSHGPFHDQLVHREERVCVFAQRSRI